MHSTGTTVWMFALGAAACAAPSARTAVMMMSGRADMLRAVACWLAEAAVEQSRAPYITSGLLKSQWSITKASIMLPAYNAAAHLAI